MIIIAEVSELTRKIKLPTDRVLSVNGDYQVDGIAFKLPTTYEGDFDFSSGAARVHWTGVDKVEHTNLLTDKDTSGRPLWIMPSELTQGGHGVIEFAVSFVATDATAAVTKRWMSDPVSFRNRRTVSGSNEDEEAEEETTYDRLASAIATVRAAQAEVEDTNAVLSSLTGSAPVPVENRSDMVDNGHLYLYTGDETGLVTGNLYYYVNGTLTNGGHYGSMEVDATLTQSGQAADAKVTGDKIAEIKEDLGDKSNLKTLDKTNIVSAINSLNGIVRIIANRDTSWAGIRENVKSGYGEILYPVGTDFSVSCPSGAPYNDIVFTVVNHRVENGEPIMTLLMKRCIYNIQFDAIQAAFAASEAVSAGTYHFKLLDGYDTGYDGGKYVQFTIVNPLAAGDQIVITWAYNQSWIGKNAYVYHAFDTTPVETCVMSEGQGGTYLGVADGSSANLNHTQRLRYGSNNWKESAVREWLNSDAQAGAWQTQQTKFQRPCSYASSKAGFISYLDPSFVAVVRTGTHLNRTNQVFDLLGTKVAYSTEERFFLLSNEELGFTSESGIVSGSLFSFYDGADNADRIKYDITNENTARTWWLRTPSPSYASVERIVNSSGALSYNSANSGIGAAAACEI